MGIVQSDLILREAVLAGLREIKANPGLIDMMLSELLEDTLTADRYGDRTIHQCKEWFTKTTIKVKLGMQVSQADLPCIAIALTSSPEAEATLGDEDTDLHPSTDPDDPSKQLTWRGVFANDSYTLACFVHGEPEYCLFLHSILLFTIFRVKDALLDQRGFMCNSYTVGPFIRAQEDGPENMYSRSITLNGKVRHTWPVRVDCVNNSATVLTDVETNIVPDAVAEPVTGPQPVIESSYATDWANLQNQDILAGVKNS